MTPFRMFTITELALLRASVLRFTEIQRVALEVGNDRMAKACRKLGTSPPEPVTSEVVTALEALARRISEHAGLSVEQCLAAELAIANTPDLDSER